MPLTSGTVPLGVFTRARSTALGPVVALPHTGVPALPVPPQSRLDATPRSRST